MVGSRDGAAALAAERAAAEAEEAAERKAAGVAEAERVRARACGLLAYRLNKCGFRVWFQDLAHGSRRLGNSYVVGLV